jgi:CheY-like chemotaxis protein
VKRIGERFRFAVEDNGPGLSEEMRDQLFQRYSQDALGRHSGGTGLGLSIAHELALLMDGNIGVDNLDQGGSRFWVEIPLSIDETAKARGVTDSFAVRVIDTDPVRADDLVVSLRSLGVEALLSDDIAARRPTSDLTVLIAARDADQAVDLRAQAGYAGHRCLISLPLANTTAPGIDHVRFLPGPWRLGAILEIAGSWHAGPCLPAMIVTPDATGIDLHNLRLLLVEDDAILRDVLSTRLRALGAIVVAAEHGLAALGELATSSFDAVILDLDLPEIDGLQVLRLSRQRLGDGTPPFVVVTARQHPDDEARCRAAGAGGFFRKPVDTDMLARCLLEIIKRGDSIE